MASVNQSRRLDLDQRPVACRAPGISQEGIARMRSCFHAQAVAITPARTEFTVRRLSHRSTAEKPVITRAFMGRAGFEPPTDGL
jgi:hypothetical protein